MAQHRRRRLKRLGRGAHSTYAGVYVRRSWRGRVSRVDVVQGCTSGISTPWYGLFRRLLGEASAKTVT
ncbi:hypothetical protein NUU61_007337 [Penicillium alfredii]|uniref:Uncharacterized protein n=1 Tax=Penicillium alfredii TaxID=1506179 RepID=A0A9W9F2V6_9EURO|nr:uncharacterized protein NUU61_007337 [Penicillium alfredii]KAJ5092467.1 hypothetical protein NUU61_007337 [Penicillium alfredii]